MRVRGKILVTTLTPQAASKNELGRLFADRWPVEVDLRHLKTMLKMEALKYKTAEMCEKALWVYFLLIKSALLLRNRQVAPGNVAPDHSTF